MSSCSTSATASVDATTEARIRLGLREAMRGRTHAHHRAPPLIALADEIVVLDGGRIAAQGRHDDDSPIYRDIYEHGLLEAQFMEPLEATA